MSITRQYVNICSGCPKIYPLAIVKDHSIDSIEIYLEGENVKQIIFSAHPINFLRV